MRSLILLFVILISFEIASAIENKKFEHTLSNSGVTNWGKEFYLTFLPCWETSGMKDRAIYISSNCRTKVTIEVPGKGYSQIQYTIPKKLIKISLATDIAQPYRKNDLEIPQPDQVWKNAGIRITADDPIICYAMSINEHSSDGFLVLPKHALGRNYIVASFADLTNNQTQWIPSYSGIVGVYDETLVEFTMGGNDWSTTASGQKPGETTTWNIGEGDVLLFAGLGTHAELTGSKIKSSKPVALVSGNFCTFVPTNKGCSDLLEEMEIPTDKWGTIYHVSPISHRKKSSIIKIFAKENNTKIYLDGNQVGFLKSSGGVEGVGYLHFRASTKGNIPVVVSGDKPISVTQFNTGQQDDNAVSDPFQMVLVPVEQYQREMTFMVPGEAGVPLVSMQYINLIYQATNWGTMPDDLEIGIFDDGKYEWKKLRDIDGAPGMPFEKVDKHLYYAKPILMTESGTYKIRSSTPFGAYLYSYNSGISYGFPAGTSLRNINSTDTLPPKPRWCMCNTGDVNPIDKELEEVGVWDKPDDPSERSNLSHIYIHNEVSYNYEFWHDDLMPCETDFVNWGLNVIDGDDDALAVITFVDCAGNDTTLFLEYNAPDIKLSPKKWDAGLHAVGDISWKDFHLINYGTGPFEISAVSLKLKDSLGDPQGFSLWNEIRSESLRFPLTIMSDDTLHFWAMFKATKEGRFWDSLGIGCCCLFKYKAILEAEVETAYIQTTDWTFPDTKIGATSYGQFEIQNKGSVDLEITGYQGPFRMRQDDKPVFESKELENLNISVDNPLIIQPNEFRNFEISFMPENDWNYRDSICFTTNAKMKDFEIDSIVRVFGIGMPAISVEEYRDSKGIVIVPNPARNFIEIKEPNPSPNERGVRVEVFDVLGQSVLSNTPSSLRDATPLLEKNNRINVSHLRPGIYFIRVGDEFLKFIKM